MFQSTLMVDRMLAAAACGRYGKDGARLPGDGLRLPFPWDTRAVGTEAEADFGLPWGGLLNCLSPW